MPSEHRLGPDDAQLTVHTGRSGAAAKAGHDLIIEVTAWEGTLVTGAAPGDTRLTLRADSRSLRVRAGHGGIQSLGDEDKDNIRQTIDEEVLRGTAIEFRSTTVAPGADGALQVSGELTLAGATGPLTVEVTLAADGALHGVATVRQSDWGMKPYSALFGTLKVSDEVRIEIDGRLPVHP